MICLNVLLLVRDAAQVDKVRDLLREAGRSSRTEPGCLRFEVYHSQAEPRRFILCEHWESAAALDAQTSAAFNAPAYAVADWTVWWQPKAVEGLRLQAGIFNIFDEKYWNALDVPTTVTASSSNLDYYTEPGRNYRLSLTYQF